jgi:cold shock CspA family protein
MKSREFGTIATYNGSYCFIKPDAADSRDVFAHSSDLPGGPIHRGDRVSYDLAPDTFKPGRMRAKAVRFVDEGGQSERAEAGMYAQDTSETALSEGLRNYMRGHK